MGIVHQIPLNKTQGVSSANYNEDQLFKKLVEETGSKFPAKNVLTGGHMNSPRMKSKRGYNSLTYF